MSHVVRSGFWKGLPHYACAFEGCVFDHLDPETIEKHWAKHHARYGYEISEGRLVPTGVVDGAGNPIMRRED